VGAPVLGAFVVGNSVAANVGEIVGPREEAVGTTVVGLVVG